MRCSRRDPISLSVLTFHLTGWCLCWLAKALSVVVPALLIGAAFAYRRAQTVLAAAEPGPSPHELEARLARILDLDMRKELPVDLILLGAASAWWFVVPHIFTDISFRFHASTIFGSAIGIGAAYVALNYWRLGRYKPMSL
jgi:hypothetical protein